MKIRVTTKDHEYQGLYAGSEHEVDDIVWISGVEKFLYSFTTNGKLWKLYEGECVEVFTAANEKPVDVISTDLKKEEYTGKSVDYYKVKVDNPTTESNTPYLAECNDLIEALGMNYAEGNAFKAIWRKCAARKLGVKKKGYDNGLYDSEKVVFFGERMVEQSKEQK
jgi:ABC-type ATPase with predicted acetyltransferase domain